MKQLRNIFILLLLCGLALSAHALPNTLHWQGKIYVQTLPFNGTGQFKFIITDGSSCLWSNTAGTSCSSMSQPSTYVTRNITQGLYDVDLGDTTLTNMAALTGNIFSGNTLYLRIWFNDGTNGFQQLTPDEKLSAVPYAMFTNTTGTANVASGIPSMTLTQRNAISSPIAGMLVFNTSDQELNVYTGSAWTTVSSAVAGSNSYMRRNNGLTKGLGNSNVVIYGTAVEANGTDITYVPSANAGDSFLANTSGIYTVVVNVGVGSSQPYIEIHVGTTIDNGNLNATTRQSRRSWISGGSDSDSLSWTGYVAAGERIWTHFNGTAGGAAYNSISIVKIASTTGGSQWTNNGLNIYYTTGNVGIGTSAPNANALLDLSSTTKAFLPPRMTTTQMNAISSPVAGMLIYNSTSEKLNLYNGSSWIDVGSAINSGLVTASYDTGWIRNGTASAGSGDWTNVRLGSSGLASDVAHNFSSPLSGLLVQFYVSSDGNDANSFLVPGVNLNGTEGFTIYDIDNNNVRVQTNGGGVRFGTLGGSDQLLDDENWYYKIKVYKLSNLVGSSSQWTTSGSNIYFASGNVGIGTNAPNANAALDVSSTTKAFLPPRMTTTQRNAISSPAAGMLIYNTTSSELNVYNGSTWASVANAVASSNSYIRRIATSIGNGTHSHVVVFGTSIQSAGSDTSYITSGANTGGFLVNTSGIYTIVANIQSNTQGANNDIRTGTALDNNQNDSKTLAIAASPGVSYPLVLSWTGFIPAGNIIWLSTSSGVNGTDYANQISITKISNIGGSNIWQLLGNNNIYYVSGNVGIGTNAPNANAALDVSSTTKAFLPPRMTTTQRDAISSPIAGMTIYNSTQQAINVYTSTGWSAITSSANVFTKDTAFLKLSANQTSHFASSDHIEFNTVAGNLALSTGSGQTNGKITLLANRKYRLRAVVFGTFTVSNTAHTWYDETNGVALTGTLGRGGSSTIPVIVEAIVTPVTNIDVSLRFGDGNTTRVDADSTMAWIESVEAYVPAIDGDQIYSTSETNTGKTWVNGKTIYRRVFTSLGTGDIQLVAQPTGITDIVHGEFILRISSTQQYAQHGFVGNSSGSHYIYHDTTTGLRVVIDSAFSGSNMVIVEYTK